MILRYKMDVDFPNYWTDKPKDDAAIDLRIVGLEQVESDVSVDSVSGGVGRLLGESTKTLCQCYDEYRVFADEDGHGRSYLKTKTKCLHWVLKPNRPYIASSGVRVNITPRRLFGLLSLRSSVGMSGICMPNSPGIIDAGYTGLIKFPLVNLTNHPIIIPYGYRMAQMTILERESINVQEVVDLGETERGDNGFGSTGGI